MKTIEINTLVIKEKYSKRNDVIRYVNSEFIEFPFYIPTKVCEAILEGVKENKKSQKIEFKNRKEEYSFLIKHSKKEYSTDFKDNLFVEFFHESLRKHCDTKSAWALWCWINFCADNKEFHELISNFWKVLFVAYEESHDIIRKSELNMSNNEQFSKLNNFLFNRFFKLFKETYLHSNKKPLHESNICYQWEIGEALIQTCLENKDLENCSYNVFKNSYKLNI